MVTGRIESGRSMSQAGGHRGLLTPAAAGDLGPKVESEQPGQRSGQCSGWGVPDTKRTSLGSELPGLFLLCGN